MNCHDAYMVVAVIGMLLLAGAFAVAVIMMAQRETQRNEEYIRQCRARGDYDTYIR